ncbi:hypothetical protein ACWCV9_36035 [Streptomyces sp. NPDC001606]
MGIATFVMRNKQYLTALRAEDDYEAFAAGAAALTRAGSVLMVVASKVIARNAARAMTKRLGVGPEAAALTEFLAETLGEEHPLVGCTRHGVAFHHGDLPDDVLHAVEQGLRDRDLLAIASTTTLTDGVNLPVRTVIISRTVVRTWRSHWSCHSAWAGESGEGTVHRRAGSSVSWAPHEASSRTPLKAIWREESTMRPATGYSPAASAAPFTASISETGQPHAAPGPAGP